MLSRGTVGRRVGLALVAISATAMLVTGIALAASEEIVAGPTESFSKSTYTSDQGEVVQFRNLGGSHNVTARQIGPDGKALFRSVTTSGGITPVNGTQYITSGDYAFFCTVHPTTMNGTLHVTGAGTPQPVPQASLVIRTKTISKAVKKGLLVAVNATSKVNGASLTAKLGKATIGQVSGLAFAPGGVFEIVKLSKSGKAKLRKKDKATVRVTADIPFGPPSSAKAKLK